MSTNEKTKALIRGLIFPMAEHIKSELAETRSKIEALSEREDRFSEKLDAMSEKLTRLVNQTQAPDNDE